jgi:hypothetical protein
MHNYKYRVRKAELVIDEINTVIKDYKEFFSFSRKIAHLAQGMVKNPRSTVKRAFHEFVNHNNNPKSSTVTMIYFLPRTTTALDCCQMKTVQ